MTALRGEEEPPPNGNAPFARGGNALEVAPWKMNKFQLCDVHDNPARLALRNVR